MRKRFFICLLALSFTLGFTVTHVVAQQQPTKNTKKKGGSAKQVQPAKQVENLALGKKATQSSTFDERNGAEKGVDGHVGIGGFFHTNIEDNPWWQVDLGQIYEITEIEVYNRTDCCSERAASLKVLIATRYGIWSTVFDNANRKIDGNVWKVPLNNTRARYVRVQLAAKEYLNLEQVKVFGKR